MNIKMKYFLNILLMSLMPSFSLSVQQQKFHDFSAVEAGTVLAADDLLMDTQHENQYLSSGSVKGNKLSDLEDKSKPNLNWYQINPEEFYRKLNATILYGTRFNSSLQNTSYDDYEDDYGCPSGQNYIFTMITIILYSLVCIIGLFGNTLVIYVVLRFSKMQTVTNIYILNLAIADECFLISIPFLLYTMQIGSWQFNEYACKAYMVSTSITQFTSSIFLLIMSADRYIAVCHPISSPRYRTPLVSKMVSGIAWLTSALLMLPVILFANTVQNGERVSCNIKWPEAQNSQSGTTFILYSLALGFATPLTFILGFYCLVIRKLHTVGPKHKSKERKRSHRKVTKLVLTVITVYILCWLPYWISQVALITSTPGKCASRLEITIFLLVGCLGYSNSAMNPILYAFLSDNFKKSFMKACTCAARKDVNAQLQMENSLFPKFNKLRPTEKPNSSNKNKHTNSLLNRHNQSKAMVTSSATTTTVTNTTTLDSANNIAICPSTQMKHLLEIPANQNLVSTSNSPQLITMQSHITENSNMENSSNASDRPDKQTVLHTDL